MNFFFFFEKINRYRIDFFFFFNEPDQQNVWKFKLTEKKNTIFYCSLRTLSRTNVVENKFIHVCEVFENRLGG